MEYVILSLVDPGRLYCHYVLWLFYNAELTAVTLVTAANRAWVCIGDIAANGTHHGLFFN
jgi:hypothetical protein